MSEIKVGDWITVPKKTNSVWFGTFQVNRINYTTGVVCIIHPKKGEGGFGIDYIIHEKGYGTKLWKALK